MGYRLTVEKVGDKTPCFYGTKLYGYRDEKKLKSYQWLIKNAYLDENKYYIWADGFDNPVLMRVEEFREFIKLYAEDLESEELLKDEDIRAFMSLYDWELIVLSWG